MVTPRRFRPQCILALLQTERSDPSKKEMALCTDELLHDDHGPQLHIMIKSSALYYYII